MSGPSKDQALQFAIMLQAGLPASEAILYFTDERDPGSLGEILGDWLKSRALKSAQLALMRRPWQELSLEERIRYALDQHYSQLAYFLFSHHVTEMGAADHTKATTARQALEAKLAGQAGRQDALSRFFDDINQRRIQLNPGQPLKKLDS